jgi:hypothetical protein
MYGSTRCGISKESISVTLTLLQVEMCFPFHAEEKRK